MHCVVAASVQGNAQFGFGESERGGRLESFSCETDQQRLQAEKSQLSHCATVQQRLQRSSSVAQRICAGVRPTAGNILCRPLQLACRDRRPGAEAYCKTSRHEYSCHLVGCHCVRRIKPAEMYISGAVNAEYHGCRRGVLVRMTAAHHEPGQNVRHTARQIWDVRCKMQSSRRVADHLDQRARSEGAVMPALLR
ncbi:hypothetical protein EJ03DRAFT_179375 [Teratosphaeria nubilosa]|uniref:Uncharacterized protein n=1 Tax=Teratosphaeria nubilosa TaxID=161662 RepID=A0A6G1L156_9PEZI|nr:hypothetical protein EJ03DRAFT_179375 [Teratosphaeria nubilosa]